MLGPGAQFLGAALAATVVTWFTFLPSFIFILAGGPLVESTHGKLQFTAPLTAITAAVVGVIASLALFFIAHIAIDTRASVRFNAEDLFVPAGTLVWRTLTKAATVHIHCEHALWMELSA